MAGLVISLKPNEKFLVNGAMLMNGPKRGQICITDDDVHVLRMSDVIHPTDVKTPVRRAYYSAQLILSGDASAEEMLPEINERLLALKDVFEGTPLDKTIRKAQNAAKAGRYYSVMCALKPLIPIEDELLAQPVPTFSEDFMPAAMSA